VVGKALSLELVARKVEEDLLVGLDTVDYTFLASIKVSFIVFVPIISLFRPFSVSSTSF